MPLAVGICMIARRSRRAPCAVVTGQQQNPVLRAKDLDRAVGLRAAGCGDGRRRGWIALHAVDVCLVRVHACVEIAGEAVLDGPRHGRHVGAQKENSFDRSESSTTPSVDAMTMKSDRATPPEIVNIDQVVSVGRIRVRTPNVSETTSVVTRARLPMGVGTGTENQSLP